MLAGHDIVRWSTGKLENLVLPLDAFENERALALGVRVHKQGRAVLVEHLGDKGDLTGWLTDVHQRCWQFRVEMICCKGIGSCAVCQEVLYPALWRSTGILTSHILWDNGYKEHIIVEMGEFRTRPYRGILTPTLLTPAFAT